MFDMIVSKVLNVFTSSALYAILAWFGLIGFVAHVIMVMLMTCMKKSSVVKSVWYMHVVSIILSFVGAPILTVGIAGVWRLMQEPFDMRSMSLFLYVWFAIIFMMTMRYFVCKNIVEVACRAWYTALLITNGVVAGLGYIVIFRIWMF
ncbi:hypothetical protein KBD08_00865 [Candidatus Babeliales bacterium]|nr:hypothetical protein [Candidatus Babeliales bacterium]